VNICM
jgi:ubiquitin carboxyl-terminal hydrolase L5